MAGKTISGDGLTADFAGMTKNQLYDIMSQMKTLIEQNKQQAREILIQNPSLTRALFQAQIMLGMVQAPQAAAGLQQPQSLVQLSHQSNAQTTHSLPAQVGMHDQTGAPHAQPPMRKPHQNQPAMSISAASAPPVSHQPRPTPSHSLQMPHEHKGHLNAHVPSMPGPQSSQHPNIPPPSLHSASQTNPHHQIQNNPSVSSQLQQPLQTTGIPHMPLQPPMPPQPRPSFHHQYGSQMGPNVGYQHGGSQHSSHSVYHPSNKPPNSMGPSFPQGSPLPNQPPPQSIYQGGGSHLGSDFNIQADRGSSWMPGNPDTSTIGQHPGPPLFAGQMGPGNQPNSSLSADMEKVLLQQVMSLTPEQINLLPPDQRNQVLQLQQMLRQGN